jgi:hypothetical protein
MNNNRVDFKMNCYPLETIPACHFDEDPDPNQTFHFDADLDPACHFDADPDPTFHFDADPDPDPNFQLKVQNLEKVPK